MELRDRFGRFYQVPEGGANYYGVMGCAEIPKSISLHYDRIAVAAGTGSTLAGIAMGAPEGKSILAVPVLRGGEFLEVDVKGFLRNAGHDDELVAYLTNRILWDFNSHGGGYGKVKPELVDFVKSFHDLNGVALDGIYTGKLLMAVRQGFLSGTIGKSETIVAIHSGGVQGNLGLNQRLSLDLPIRH